LTVIPFTQNTSCVKQKWMTCPDPGVKPKFKIAKSQKKVLPSDL